MSNSTMDRTYWSLVLCWLGLVSVACGQVSMQQFEAEALPALPIEESFDFLRELAEGIPPRPRDPAPRQDDELEIGAGWTIEIPTDASAPLVTAAEELQRYLQGAMQMDVPVHRIASVGDWQTRKHVIVAAERGQMPDCGDGLKASKDYRIRVASDAIGVCGFDQAGAAFGLYNLAMRFHLREAPYLPRKLDTLRHSVHRTRMVASGLGWMEWPDRYLATLPLYGFDAIFCSEYRNPNNAPYGRNDPFRKHAPGAMKDLLQRAARFGLKVYTPIMFNYTGTAESAAELRKLARDNLTEFPEIRGYVLLSEGFDSNSWKRPPGEAEQKFATSRGPYAFNAAYLPSGTSPQGWAEAVRIFAEEAHRVNPQVEVLPWDYTFDFAPDQAEAKAALMEMLPESTIPLLTFENGKGFELDGQKSFLRDYAINQVGPSECTAAQLQVIRKRKFPAVYSKADTFASWQFGAFPYLPFPEQWHARYQALEQYQIDGTLESWSYGFKPNWVAELRAWYAWSDAPPLDDLLNRIARREFGPGNEEAARTAWKHFSQAIRLYPDTGPNRGSCNAVAMPLRFVKPEPRVVQYGHSWARNQRTVQYVPGQRRFPLFEPDFTNQRNAAAEYTSPLTLPVFQKYLKLAADELEQGLQSYRQAALRAPAARRTTALREVLLAEQLQRMMRSEHAVIEFETMRVALAGLTGVADRRALLDQMVALLKEESQRTKSSWKAARRDSRLGYEPEQDYLYTPEQLDEKFKLIDRTLHHEIPEYRRINGL
jgi:hypothetical protein